MNKSICIFASSSNNIDKKYFEDAKLLGELLAKNNYDIIYGGSNLGLMGCITQNAKNMGSNIIGVMPEKLYNLGISQGPCDKFIVTKGMRERKAKMDELSSGVIALAGGFGTLEELSEMIVQKQLGYNYKPIIILNTKGYYNNLINFFEDIVKHNFAHISSKKLFYVANTPNDAVNYLNDYKQEKINYLADKIKKLT